MPRGVPFTSNSQPDYEKRPARGRDKRSLILDALRSTAQLGLANDASNDAVETAWFAHMAKVALDPDHKDSGICKQALMDRGWSKLKPASEFVNFDYNKDGKPIDNASSIIESVATGEMNPDTAAQLLGALKDIIAIAESTELIQRLEAIELALKENKG